jgi:sugar phosphate isomerase/epimerase
MARDKGLDFVEFCINGDDRGEKLFSLTESIKRWMREYGVAVGSIGRWKSEILLPDGSVDPNEISLAGKLMRTADELGCDNYICGCNYIDSQSYYANITRAIEFFTAVLAQKPKGMNVSVYNCRKMNFINTPEAWKLVLGHLPELGIKYDPSHAIRDGADYLSETLEWGDRIRHVHLKGSLVINGVAVDDPPAGLDNTNWRAFLGILRAKGYDRCLSIEPHSPVWQGELGDAGIDYTVRYMKELLVQL